MICYRKAEREDAEELANLRLTMLCQNTGYSKEFRKLLKGNAKEYLLWGWEDNSLVVWIAEDGEKIIAMGGISFFRLPPNDWCPAGKSAYIGNLYTALEYRRQGIAARLLEKLMEEGKAAGCERILLNTTDMGRGLYEKFGFKTSPTAMAYYPFGTEVYNKF